MERQPEVRIFGEKYRLRARVESIQGFSAHADRGELLDWVAHFQRRPQHTYVVHGDEDVSLAFADTLRKTAGLPDVNVPTLGQTFTV